MFYNSLTIPHHPMRVANQVHFFNSNIAGGPDPLLPTCSNSNITQNGVVLFGIRLQSALSLCCRRLACKVMEHPNDETKHSD